MVDSKPRQSEYTSDFTQKDLLFGALLTSPPHTSRYQHRYQWGREILGRDCGARDRDPGTEVDVDGQEIGLFSANTEEIAKDATRKIKVEYEVDAAPGPRRRPAKSDA